MSIDISKIPVPPLPTLTSLNATVPDDLDAQAVASKWLTALSEALESNKLENVGGLFVEDSWWRDMLALTWDFRTFQGASSITAFLSDRIKSTHPRSFKLRQDFLGLQRPTDDIAWINAFFDFETDVGIGIGIFRLVPTANGGEWKAHAVYTNLENLKAFPEKIASLRDGEPNHGRWEEDRKREREFEGIEPVVLVIGAGHSGLDVAARLKACDVPTLVIERNERIGDNWRNRYEALCLHDPVWYDHMPYLPFPPTWPVYAPARKLANWLEHYADALDLNVWTSTTVTQAVQDPTTNKWNVIVKRVDGTERVFCVKHLIFATGLTGTVANVPKISGMEKYKGQILHSSQHKRAVDHAGKKVVIVGACTSAHDIAHDYYNHGVDVTMYQRSSTYIMTTKSGWEVFFKGLYEENGPPVDIADRLVASIPSFMGIGLLQLSTQKVAEMDRELLDALHKRGFRTNLGLHGTGLFMLAFSKAGGYYLDVGASQLIADGKIKLKNDSQIKEVTETGLLFENGSELAADVIVFATGLSDIRENIRQICGDGIADRCPAVWGFDEEGEMIGNVRELAVPNLWYMTGNYALSRFHSKHLALQIKAKEEGLLGERYSRSA